LPAVTFWPPALRTAFPIASSAVPASAFSLVGLGGYHIGMQSDEQESIKIIRTALNGGINFLDNCWDYNGGDSEIRMGKALRDGYRQKAFLMTKIDGQTRKAATAQIDESLRRLQTDHLESSPIPRSHSNDRPGAYLRSRRRDGSRPRSEKSRRFATSVSLATKSAMHLHMLETAAAHQFHFDAVQMPLNAMDAHYESFGQKVLPVLVKNEIGVLGMKPMGRRSLLRSNTLSPVECLHFAMNLPPASSSPVANLWPTSSKLLTPRAVFKPLTPPTPLPCLPEQSKRPQRPVRRLQDHQQFRRHDHNPQWLG